MVYYRAPRARLEVALVLPLLLIIFSTISAIPNCPSQVYISYYNNKIRDVHTVEEGILLAMMMSIALGSIKLNNFFMNLDLIQ